MKRLNKKIIFQSLSNRSDNFSHILFFSSVLTENEALTLLISELKLAEDKVVVGLFNLSREFLIAEFQKKSLTAKQVLLRQMLINEVESQFAACVGF